MKKVKFNGKLNLSKERISNLSANQMNNIKGGGEVIGEMQVSQTLRVIIWFSIVKHKMLDII